MYARHQERILSSINGRHLAKGGVKAVFVNGTTGEGVQVFGFSF